MSGSRFILAPSILSADFSNLQTALADCQRGDAEYIHLDVMDGNFVPNITIGPAVIKALRPHSKAFFDVHIMVCDPLFWIEPFANAGADGITFHVEATGRPGDVIDLIRSYNIKTGITLKPGTNIELVEPFLEWVDLILVMSVEPGFGGQQFMPQSLTRIRELRRFIDNHNLSDSIQIQVDGGVNLDNAAEIIEAGASNLVAGSAVFNTPDPVETMQKFRKIT